jgi:hypothetical protein
VYGSLPDAREGKVEGVDQRYKQRRGRLEVFVVVKSRAYIQLWKILIDTKGQGKSEMKQVPKMNT